MFKKILIANRGEIALRVIRACRELEISSVAIYSQIDRDSLHVRFADEAFCVGPPHPKDSYLNIPNIVSGADILKVDAIHPGYGFLSENSKFIKILEECNFKFIGPDREIIELTGNKAKTIEIMKNANIPVINGIREKIENEDELLQYTEKIGYPLMIKAKAGGGGRGVRIVENIDELIRTIPIVKKEAEINFESDDFYIEKYLQNVRHIEFQIIADNSDTICLGERECTIQRRHQKIIEEAPSCFLDNNLRKKMIDAAIKCAKILNYKNLGTIEFLVDENKKFYFIEVNPRIQVEHPVTEMVIGLDLIKEQIKLSEGKKLSLKQNQARPRGHCIECRILSEDAENNFLPSTGRIEGLYIPGGFGVRVDTHIYPNYEIMPYYDSLLAKLICWGKDRQDAISRCLRALNEFKISGVKTNIPFLIKIMKNKNFIKGDVTTNFIEEVM